MTAKPGSQAAPHLECGGSSPLFPTDALFDAAATSRSAATRHQTSARVVTEAVALRIGSGVGSSVVTVPGYEFLYAQRQGRKTWVIMAGEHCRRDRPLAKLDLPSEADHPDPDEYQAERRALQQAHMQRLKAENPLRHHAASDTELDNIVLRLRDELGELRRRWERQHRRLMGAIAGVLIGLLILGGGGWWAYRSLHQDVQQANVVTAEKIHAHLLQTVDQTYRQQLAEADQAADWKNRQRLREAAVARGRLDAAA